MIKFIKEKRAKTTPRHFEHYDLESGHIGGGEACVASSNHRDVVLTLGWTDQLIEQTKESPDVSCDGRGEGKHWKMVFIMVKDKIGS